MSNALKFTGRSGSVRLSLSVESSSSGGGNGGESGDIETGKSTGIAASFFNQALGRSSVRYSKTFAEVTYLVMSVHDSGVGISAVRSFLCQPV